MDEKGTNPKQAIIDKLKQSTNILVTVSANPSVDQLAACLGLTLWLNKAGKHATAVFSGDVPSTLEFLKPEETLEKNTDSLRDFIISLDKSKADKLRYKVEDKVVKIFITPYRTSLSADDLEYSQGDFNVDMVLAVGVHAQEDLDTAITAHGRILHDATVATITTGDKPSELGSVNWHDNAASSLSELGVELGNGLDKTQLDGQIATALLTGVVAETDRFSNEKTTPQTMSVSAQLMSAGANQQLVASKLEEPVVEPEVFSPATTDDQSQDNAATTGAGDGTLEIDHPEGTDEPPETDDQPVENIELPPVSDQPVDAAPSTDEPASAEEPHDHALMTEAPAINTPLTANTEVENEDNPTSDPLTTPSAVPLLNRDQPGATTNAQNDQPASPDWMPQQSWLDNSATQSPAADQPVPAEPTADAPASPDLDAARDEVLKAVGSVTDANPEPIQALNAQPISLDTPPTDPSVTAPMAEPSTTFDPAAFGVINDPELPTLTPPPPAAGPTAAELANTPVDPDLTEPVEQPFTMPVPSSPLTPPPGNPVPPTSASNDPSAPPVPPPMYPPAQ